MARESDFINKLSDFTKSLEDLVDLLKEQQKIGPTEVVNKLLENIDAEKLSSIAENIEQVKENTIEINKNVEKTLKVVEELKKGKESGLPGEISNKDNKAKVLDGIKTIILIAGGVLAIGLAFKIIGKVDFLSVVALSFGIMAAATAFAVVASLTDKEGNPLKWKQIVMGAAVMVVMAGALLIAGMILKNMPPIGLSELISATFVGAAMGISAYLLLSAISNIKNQKSLLMVPLVAAILPLIALAIVGAGFILQEMPIISFKQLLSTLLVGIALIPIVWGFQYLIKATKNVKIQDAMLATSIIPLLALGIVTSSWILMGVADIDLIKVLKGGLGVGIATLAMIPTMFLLKKAGLLEPAAIKSLAIGVLAVPLISLAIMLSSWILAAGNYSTFPSLEWTLSVGLAIILFSVPVAVIGALMLGSGGIGYAALAAGILAVPLIALAMVAVSYILPLGDYSSYPPLEWTASVGLAMLLFTVPVIALGILIMSGVGLPALILGIIGVSLIGASIVAVSHVLPLGNYSSYPPLEWTASVGLAMLLFTLPVMALGIFILTGVGLPALVMGILGASLIARSIVEVSYVLPLGTYSIYPSLEWSSSVGLAMFLFGVPVMTLGLFILTGVGLPALILGIIGIGLIARAVVEVSYILPMGDYSGGYPTLEWTSAVGLAMFTFGLPIMSLGAYMITGVGIAALILGITAFGLIAASVVAVSYLLNTGSYGSYPSVGWSSGVALSLMGFGLPAMTLGSYIIGSLGLGLAAITTGLSTILLIAGTISAVSLILNTGNYKSYPSKEWAQGVAETLSSFGNIDLNFSFESLGKIMLIGSTMLGFAAQMYIIDTLFSNVFSEDGTINRMSSSIDKLINVLPTKDKIDPLWSLVDALNALSGIGWKDLLDMGILSQIIGSLSEQIDKLNSEKIDSLAKLGVGLQIISLVNEEKLKSVLEAIKEKSATVTEIMDDNGGYIQSLVKGLYEAPKERKSAATVSETPAKGGKTEDDFEKRLLQHISNIDVNIGKMAGLSKEEKEERLKPKDADGNEKTFSWSN
jgi:hypothetical protein